MRPVPRVLLVCDAATAGSVDRFAALLRVALAAVDEDVGVVARVLAVDVGPYREVVRGLARDGLAWRGSAAEARALGLTSVHWPDGGGPAREGMVRVTAAVHAARAVPGADARVFGPVLSPRSKRAPAAGWARLAEVCASPGAPVLALGGIGPEEVAAARGAGAEGVASLGGWCLAEDPVRAVRALVGAARAEWAR